MDTVWRHAWEDVASLLPSLKKNIYSLEVFILHFLFSIYIQNHDLIEDQILIMNYLKFERMSTASVKRHYLIQVYCKGFIWFQIDINYLYIFQVEGYC